MTSTIGIPIKLLNEAQGHIVTLEITSGQTYRGKLLEGAFYSKKFGWKFEFALTYSSSSSHSRGQYEHSAQRHHRHGARRARQPSRPGLHPWKPRAVLHRAGYVEVRSVNPQNPESRIQCFECMNANPASRCLGTRLCSRAATPGVVVSVWREDERRSAGPGQAVAVEDNESGSI